ncbi:MAG: hypothetical protein KAG96_02685 [Ichthyobacteriaceae bacterium]|nr:hypothetical protein [Ichthyobacteriaceae bacterium]
MESSDKLKLQKKIHYKVSNELSTYLKKHSRDVNLPIAYDDLMRYTNSIALVDDDDNDTLWVSVAYNQFEQDEIQDGLKHIYKKLIMNDTFQDFETVRVDRIDYCTFGNSHPFRIKIINIDNDNYDYFYVKKADASRVYGLELEHLLSPNRMHYFVHNDTLIEEHIMGIPGDQFLETRSNLKKIEYVRIAKEFVKFNERCVTRLLGDMRSYNFVMVETHDFDQNQYRIRAIDFDQQSYEGRLNLYRPQFFKENKPFVDLVARVLTPESILQYQREERYMIARRARITEDRVNALLSVMVLDRVSTNEKVNQLSKELRTYIKVDTFETCNSMGGLLRKGLDFILRHYIKQ